MEIRGKQIYLRERLVEDNYPLLLDWFHDLEVMGYIGWAKKSLALENVQQVKDFVAELEDGIFFGIYDKAADAFIGYTVLSRFVGKEECEFGIFILDKAYRGRGIGKEVTDMMLKYAFDDLEIRTVALSTSELHEKAIRLYEKCGFVRKKLIPNDRTILHNGQWILSGTVEMEIRTKQS